MKKVLNTKAATESMTEENSNNTYNFKRLKLSTLYHLDILRQNNKILNTIIKIIWIEFILIVILLTMFLYEKTTFTVVTCILTIFSQFTSVILFSFITLHNKERKEYFNHISYIERSKNDPESILNLEEKAEN